MVLFWGVVTYLFLADHEAHDRQSDARRRQPDGAGDETHPGRAGTAARQDLAAKAYVEIDPSVAYLPGESLPSESGTTDTQVGEQIGKELICASASRTGYDAKRFGEFADLRILVDGGGAALFSSSASASSTSTCTCSRSGSASSLILLRAILFLRNQIWPIQRPRHGCRSFGAAATCLISARRAIEVRRAAIAFIAMKQRTFARWPSAPRCWLGELRSGARC